MTIYRKKRILIAEDETATAYMIMRELYQDYSVSVVDNGLDLFRLALSTRPAFDLIISDIMMPYGEGSDMVFTLQTLDIKTPVILISALDNVVIPDGIPFFKKPFEMDELIDKARALLLDG